MSQEIMARELLDEIDLSKARGRPVGSVPLEVEVVRPLGADDIELLRDAPVTTSLPAWRIERIKHIHHRLAQLLVQGKSPEYISAITGHTPAHIKALSKNPGMQDLMAYYATNEEIIYADVLERMRNLQIASLEELQKRLDEEPEGWTKRELMDLQKDMAAPLVARLGARGGGSPDGTSGGLNIGITFVSPQGADSSKMSPQIDATFVEAQDAD